MDSGSSCHQKIFFLLTTNPPICFSSFKPNSLGELSMLSILILCLPPFPGLSFTHPETWPFYFPTHSPETSLANSLLLKPSDHFWPYLTWPLDTSVIISYSPLLSSSMTLYSSGFLIPSCLGMRGPFTRVQWSGQWWYISKSSKILMRLFRE